MSRKKANLVRPRLQPKYLPALRAGCVVTFNGRRWVKVWMRLRLP